MGPGLGRGHKGERGEGFRTVDRLNIREALEDPRFSGIAGQVRDRIITIVRSYIESGVNIHGRNHEELKLEVK